MKDERSSVPMFSLIIPINNCEKYLSECLESILQQTYQDFEIICVDDGSTDNSFQILQEYANKDARITVKRQKNKGAGAARNVGLAMARGEYVYFPDSDDICNKELLQVVEKKLTIHHPDIVVFKALAFNQTTKEEVLMYENFAKLKVFGEVFSAATCTEDIFSALMIETWNKVYSRGFLMENILKYQELVTTNDLFFTCSALCLAQCITTVDAVLYKHRVGLRTNLQSQNDRSFLDFYKALVKLHEGVIKLKNENFLKSFRELAVNVIFYNLLAYKNENNRKELIKKIREEAIPRFGLYKNQLNFFQGQLCDYVTWGDNMWVIGQMYGLNKFVGYAGATGWKNAIKKILQKK